MRTVQVEGAEWFGSIIVFDGYDVDTFEPIRFGGDTRPSMALWDALAAGESDGLVEVEEWQITKIG